MLNAIWLGLVLVSVVVGAYTGHMDAVSVSVFDGAKNAVDLVIRLVGIMMLFLGLMRIARDGGLLHAIVRVLEPLLRRLFPDIDPEHPAMGAMILNLASNVLGLGNAATPFGLKAMKELDSLNPRPGIASDSMILFLAINATSVSLAPLGTIAVRSAVGSTEPAAIWVPTLVATTVSTLTAVAACYALRRLRRYRLEGRSALAPPAPAPEATPGEPESGLPPKPPPMGPARRMLVWSVAAALLAGLALHIWNALPTVTTGDILRDVAASWLIPLLVAVLVLVGLAGRVPAYEAAVEGAKEGLDVAVRILPFLVIILVAVAMFQKSGALDMLIHLLNPVTSRMGVPAEALPMALIRPLSGSGALGVMTGIMTARGPDSFVGLLVSSYQGTTETTFYVLAIYFGAARVRDGRYALAACLAGDLAGFAAATAMCHLLFR